ncbi:unnamed protein product [Cyclocybe aegerita]|uniref:Uncharacterized protein n=1 Tax=Cyclocybe aegerita TaxID=1973307 RepID=A0A8S0WB60_CYCAE|nr:unnamed protein product [Cyclocybe aegerita]
MAFRSFPTTLLPFFTLCIPTLLSALLATVVINGPLPVKAAPPNNTLYIISNAETPSLRLPGLTPVGLTRVQECLPPLLSPLDIGLIIACPFDPDSGLCKQTEATARPTAEYIGLEVDTSCGADEETDDDCVPDLIKEFGRNSTQSVLIVWDINDLDSLFENLDVDDDWEDDDDEEDELSQHHDVLYTVVKRRVTSIVSQGCAGIDGQAPGTFRKRSLTYRGLAQREEAP